MAYIFDMSDNSSIERINRVRQEIFFLKENTASLSEKKVIASAAIRFDAHQRKDAEIWELHGGKIASNHCKILEFHVTQELFREVANTGKQEEIEESIRQAFIKRLPSINQSTDSIDKVTICILPKNNIVTFFDGIFTDINWYNGLDLVTETPTPTQDKLKEESKPKEEEQVKALAPNSNPRVFIVHGQNHAVRNELKLMLHDMKAIPILLEDVPSGSKTLIELLDKEISSIDFVVVLMIPDDVGGANKDGVAQKPRVRQNVIYGYGIAIGKISRERIIVIRNKDELEMPSDIGGVRYYDYEHNIKEVEMKLQKEFREHGFAV